MFLIIRNGFVVIGIYFFNFDVILNEVYVLNFCVELGYLEIFILIVILLGVIIGLEFVVIDEIVELVFF